MRLFYLIVPALAMASVGDADVVQNTAPENRTMLSSQILQKNLNVRTASVTVANVRGASLTVVQGAAMGDYTIESGGRAVEDYFNNLTTLKANFSQTVTGDSFVSEGTFYLKKPRQFVWQYETPNRQKIISNGTAAYYVDQERGKQVTQLPMDAGLGRIFGARGLNLAKEGLRVTGVKSNPRELWVTMVVGKGVANDQAGLKSVTLGFDRVLGNNLRIKSITALDTLQATTAVTFTNVEQGIPLAAKLFEFTPGVYKSQN